MLGEFGDAPGRYASAKARKNYAGTSPLTIQSGKKKTVHARYIRNRHLIDALHTQAFAALTASPGARAYYDELRAREIGHEAALRRVASRAHRRPARMRDDRTRIRRSHRVVPPRHTRAGRITTRQPGPRAFRHRTKSRTAASARPHFNRPPQSPARPT